MEGALYFTVLLCLGAAFADGRIYSIAVGDDWGAHEYRNEYGYLVGFGIDLLDMVCTEGNIDCRMMYMPYQYCFNSTEGVRPAAGPAIQSRWVDGCSGWAVTRERIAAVKYTASWMKRIPHFFFVKKGNSLNPDNLEGKRIGFVNGWAASEQCVARALKPLDTTQMFHRNTPGELLDALNKDEIQAIYSTEPGWTEEQAKQLTKINRPLYCTLAGTAIMTRKDSDLPSVFNSAFNKIKNTPRWEKFCQETNEKHASGSNMIDCI